MELVISDGKNVENPLLKRAFEIKDQQECKAVYKDWAETYDETMVGELNYTAPQTIAKTMDQFLDSKEATILDLGSGTGLVGQALFELGYKNVDGADFSPQMLEVAAKRKVYRELMLADLTKEVDIPTASYDGTICAGLFTYGHLDASCLDEIFRVLKPGAIFSAAIREQIWTEMGFAQWFAQKQKAKSIIILSDERMDNYQDSNKKDGVYLVVKKLSDAI